MADGLVSLSRSISLSKLLTAAAVALSCVSAQAALQGRDLNGSPGSFEAYYDTDLNITWLADWNYAKTSGFDADGLMNWSTANTTWINSLNAGPGLYGVNDWRLPTVSPVNGSTFQYGFSNNGSTDFGSAKTGAGGGWGLASEMGHLFYVTLGNKGYCTPNDASPGSCTLQTGSGLTNTGLFVNMQSSGYWSGTEYAPVTSFAWYFGTIDGFQGYVAEGSEIYAVAVRPGDVAAAPEPGTLALLGLGLAGLAASRRRKQ